MWHLLANDLPATAGSGPGVFQQVPAIADPEFSQSGALDYQIPKDLYVAAIAALSTQINAARINTATLRLRGFPQVYPFEVVAVWPTDPNVMDLRRDPLRLRSQEDYRLELDDQGGGAARATLFSVISDQPIPPTDPPQGSRWVSFTASISGVAGFWSGPVPMVLSDVLEADLYACHGFRFLDDANSTAIAARLWFQGQTYKPGCLAENALGQRSADMFRGGLGEFGRFRLYSLPQVELLDTAAAGATTYQIALLLNRIG